MFTCKFCSRSYSRMDNLKRHGDCRFTLNCEQCGRDYKYKRSLQRHKKTSHSTIKQNPNIPENVPSTSAGIRKTRIATHRLYSNQDKTDGLQFPNQLEKRAVKLIKNHVESFGSIKVDVKLSGRFLQQQTHEQKQLKSFSTQFRIVCEESDLQELYEGFAFIMEHQYSEFREKYDGWALQELLYLNLSMNKFDPLEA